MEQVLRVINGCRITIPQEIREKLGFKEGEYVIARVEGRGLRLIPAEVHPKTSEPKRIHAR